jgi:hypothetical protein
MRSVIYTGCSFTWGQGLWSYCPTKWYVPTCTEYTEEDAPIPHIAQKFRIENRFAGLLERKLQFRQIVKRRNGGTDLESLQFIDLIKKNRVNLGGGGSLLEENVNWNEIDWCIFQTTQAYRSPFRFEYKGDVYEVRANPGFNGLSILEKILSDYDINLNLNTEVLDTLEPFLNWLVDNNLTPDDFLKIHTKQIITNIENKFKELENEGIKCLLFCWTDEYLNWISESSFLQERFVRIKYENNYYDTLEELMSNFELSIQNDKTKLHECGGDNHPSLKLHQLIANSLEEKILIKK